MHSNRVKLDQVERLMTAREVCEVLHVSLATLNRMERAGQIRSTRPSGPRGDRRYRPEEVDELRSRCSNVAPVQESAA